MKKNIIVFICMLSTTVYAQSFYNDFIKINNSLIEDSGFIAKQSLIKIDTEKQTEDKINAFSLFYKDNEFTILESTKEFSILSTKSGYWIKNLKTKTPIKVSGSYIIDEIQMQDILRIDFSNDYKPVEEEKQKVLLARNNKKTSYSYFEISEEFDNEKKFYLAKAMDSNKKVLKEIKYFSGEVSGLICFYRIEIQNAVLNIKTKSILLTEKISRAKTPEALFKSEYISELVNYVKKYKKEL